MHPSALFTNTLYRSYIVKPSLFITVFSRDESNSLLFKAGPRDCPSYNTCSHSVAKYRGYSCPSQIFVVVFGVMVLQLNITEALKM